MHIGDTNCIRSWPSISVRAWPTSWARLSTRLQAAQIRSRDAGFRTVLVYCLGAQGCRCHHTGRLRLADLPDWDWRDITAHLKCTKCGAVGWVDTRLDWSEVIDFNKGIS